MDPVVIGVFAVAALLGAGFLVGCLVGRARQRRLQRELAHLQLALQQSRSEGQQREDALHRSHQELQQSREELQRTQHEVLRRQEEAAQYRAHVTHHFLQTAELLQTLTLQYRAVYDHLALGAATLCEGQVTTFTPETLRERLLAPPPAATAADGVAPAESQAPAPETAHSLTPSSADTSSSESVNRETGQK